MNAQHVIDVDLATVYRWPPTPGERPKFLRTVVWGHGVELVDATPEYIRIKTANYEEQPDGSIVPQIEDGYIKPSNKAGGRKPEQIVIPKGASRVLKIDFIDVQQGDGCVIETPEGEVILIDGGDNQLFARYLASRFRGTSDADPKEIDHIVVTHGDADHFCGLTEIYRSETNATERKRLFIRPRRVYHNGLVKRPASRGGVRQDEDELLGETRQVGDELIVTGLVENLLDVDDEEMNEPFRDWKGALKFYHERRGPIAFHRLARGAGDPFGLSGGKIKVEVFGPEVCRYGDIAGLRFLGERKKGRPADADLPAFAGRSASHTINGHSIVLRLSYGAFRLLFAGDLNEEAEYSLTRAYNLGELDLRAEVFKVPHHGSADFLAPFIEAVSPVISVVSSGDENERKEYIHPRANLMAALGRHSREVVEGNPVIFVTELVAFFKARGWSRPEPGGPGERGGGTAGGTDTPQAGPDDQFYAFQRTAFGTIKVRTDGERLLVCTNSGLANLKEAYAYKMNQLGQPRSVDLLKA